MCLRKTVSLEGRRCRRRRFFFLSVHQRREASFVMLVGVRTVLQQHGDHLIVAHAGGYRQHRKRRIFYGRILDALAHIRDPPAAGEPRLNRRRVVSLDRSRNRVGRPPAAGGGLCEGLAAGRLHIA